MTPELWREVERVYHATLEREVNERAAFLENACHGDEGLRREVESLLAYQGPAKDFIETPAGTDLRAPIAAALRRHEMAVAGQRAGRVFGVYELKSLIAAGGMGEVYRAIDTRLNRTVAIKILPQHLSNDPDRRQRFKREAKVISSLNHPHICTLHDIGVQDGVDYLVMEYIDGQTLQKRLAGGALPLARALEYAIQIVDALDKAHRSGVVHRDLKPANIMLTGSGVKLLDFGLAIGLTATVTASENQSAENPEGLTREGTVMGTPEYSSPEQLQGKPVDARTDIFSFGATAFEMMTGQRAFPGESTAAAVTAILHEDPRPLRELLPDLPASLERTLYRCLSKNPDERWQTATDLLFELRSIASASPAELIARPPPRRVVLRVERFLWIAALLGIIVAAILWARRAAMPHGAQVQETSDLRFSLYPAQGTYFHAGYDVSFALSPDGRRIVYVAVTNDGIKQLWLRELSSDTELAEPMQGTDGANSPFWSPDSQWIGFFAGNSLKTIRVSTGVVQVVANNVSTMAGAAWSADDVIVFPAGPNVLVRVSARGGPLSVVSKGEDYFWPQFLPDGKHFLYAAAVQRELGIGSIEGEPSRMLMKFPVRASSLAYVPGYVFFVQDETLFARPFDDEHLNFSGEPIRLLDGVPVTPPGRAPFSVSRTGLLAYWNYPGGTPSVLQWFDRDGHSSAAVDTPAKYVGFSLSPDGRRVAVSRRAPDGGADLWIRDLVRGAEVQLTFDGAAYAPRWSPDSTRILFTGPGRNPPPKLFIKSLAERIVDVAVGSSPAPNFASAWSRDGNSIISVRMDPANGNDLWVERLRERVSERLPVNTPSNESQGKLSPDDRWLAYVTDESGKSEVWVASFPSGGIRRQVSAGGGTSPEWGKDNQEIFYVSKDKRLIATPLRAGQGGVELGPPRPLFSVENLVETEQIVMPTSNSYAAAFNGQRFLVAVRVRDPSAPPIRILVNWRSLLNH